MIWGLKGSHSWSTMMNRFLWQHLKCDKIEMWSCFMLAYSKNVSTINSSRGCCFIWKFYVLNLFSTLGHSSQTLFFGEKKQKKCWNQILFETQSFSPRLTVKYILAPLRKRNDKCEERERGKYKFYILYQTAKKIYFRSIY